MKNLIKLAVAAVVIAASVISTSANPFYWRGGSSLNWTDGANWSDQGNGGSTGTVPDSTGVVYMQNNIMSGVYGWSTNIFVVNNIVDTSTNIKALNYTALTNHYYTTKIPSSVVLTLGGGGMVTPALAVGDIPGAGSWNAGLTSLTNFSAMTGAGTLNVYDTNGLVSVGWQNRATLDLSTLNTFTATVSNLWVGVSQDQPNTTGPTGWLLLAATNTITTSSNLAGPAIIFGYRTNTATGVVFLGNTNGFYTDGLVVGACNKSSPGQSIMNFGPFYSNTIPRSSFSLRGAGGGPAGTFAIGDLSATPGVYATTTTGIGTSVGASGVADFTGGDVDISADSIYVGRSARPEIGTITGTGTGVLVLQSGTVSVTNLYVGYKQPGANASAGNGTLILRSNVTVNVVKDMYLGFRTNGATANPGTLAVTNGATLNIGGNLIAGQGATAMTIAGTVNVTGIMTNTINGPSPAVTMLGGVLNVAGGGPAYMASLAGFGRITNASSVNVTNPASSLSLGFVNASSGNQVLYPGTLDVPSLVLYTNVIGPKFKLGSSLTPGGNNSDYLIVRGNLNLSNNPVDLQFIGQPTVGSYDLVNYTGTTNSGPLFNLVYNNATRSYGFALDYTIPNHIKLNVTGSPGISLTWKGKDKFWDTTNTMAWNNNTEKFYSYDNVSFDDTGTNTFIFITGTVLQGGMTFNNNTKQYVLSDNGSGKLSGYGGLTKNGTGTLVWNLTSGTGDWNGPININNGTLQVINAASGAGALFGATNKLITIAPGATLDVYAGNPVGSGAIAWPITFSGTGMGGIGAIANTRLASSSGATLNSPILTMTGNASIGTAAASIGGLTLQGTTINSVLNLGGNTLTMSGGGFVYLNSLVADNSGNIQVNCPNLYLRDVRLGGAGTLNMGSSMLTLASSSLAAWSMFDYTISKAISIGNSRIMAPASGGVTISVSSPITLTGSLAISNNQPINMSGVISGGYAITKTGTAVLTLGNANTYSGNTIVSGGTLVLGASGSINNSPLVRVDSIAALDVSAYASGYAIPSGKTVQVDGTAAGNFNVATGSTLQGSGTCQGAVGVNGGSLIPGKLDLPRTLTVGTLALTNANMTFELGATTTAGGNVNDLVNVTTGQPVFSGTSTIKIVPAAALITGSPYTLFTYNAATLPASVTNNLNLVTDTRYTFTFVDPSTTPGSIQIMATASSAPALTWKGGAPSAPTAWDINTTTNWFDGVNGTNFFNGDVVYFDDNANTTVATLMGQLRPTAMSMDNNSLSYVLQGAGSLRAGSLTNNGSSGLTIANTNDNILTGGGLFMNVGSTLTFNQPTNATFTGNLNTMTGFGGPGVIVKEGANSLTLIGDNNAATFSGPIQVNNGTLIAGSTNVFGTGTVTVTNNNTSLDINGQVLRAQTLAVSGTGANGQGVLINSGNLQSNALYNITLNDDATFGGVSRWDATFGGSFQGNNHTLTKNGSGEVWIASGTDTGLGNINVTNGTLTFAFNGTGLGSSGNITVYSNAVLSFAADVAAGTKPTTVKAGGIIQGGVLQTTNNDGFHPSIGVNNSYAGEITFEGGGLLKVTNGAGLTLSGNIHGPAGMTNIDVGTLILGGSNDYAGNLIVGLGTVYVTNQYALPGNSTALLDPVRLGAPGSSPYNSATFGLIGGVVMPANVTLQMESYRLLSGDVSTTLYGDGTWNGPLNLNGYYLNPSQTPPQFSFRPSFGGTLTINGPITVSGITNTVNCVASPGNVVFNRPLVIPSGTFSSGAVVTPANNNDHTVVVLATNGNDWAWTVLNHGKIIIGTNEALPSATLWMNTLASFSPRYSIIDLSGHTQSVVEVLERNLSANTFGNGNTNADAKLIFNGRSTVTNIFQAVQLIDGMMYGPGYDTLTNGPQKLKLDVTAGTWVFAPRVAAGVTNTYTGPTHVSGGILVINSELGNTAVTVDGSGTFGGKGTVAGNVTVNSGGTLITGTDTFGNARFTNNIIGVLTNTGNLTINTGGTALMKVNITTATNDAVVGINTLTYGGTLRMTNLAGSYANGKVFRLFSATAYNGGFNTVSPLKPDTGLVWYTNNLTVNGTLVVTNVMTNSPNLAMTRSGSNLTLSWPLDHVGWRLTLQTNNLTTGITTNAATWYTYPNSTNLQSVTVTIDKNNPTVFYRLVYP